ncbi:MAG: hypothetical protein ACRBN8_19780 [Nannocystales bacterium]
MMFRYIGPEQWAVHTAEGWDRLPAKTRPSEVMKRRRAAFVAPTPTRASPERRCDTQHEYELAIVHRVAARVAARTQRSVEAIQGRTRRPGLHTARGLVVRACRSLGVQSSPLAAFFGRCRASISVYATDLEREMRRRPELRRTFCEVYDEEQHAETCVAVYRPMCSGSGTEAVS